MCDSHQSSIVVGVDGSDSSRQALEWAAAEADRRDLPLHLLCAWDVDYSAQAVLPLSQKIENDCRITLVVAAAHATSTFPDLHVHTSLVPAQAASALIAASRFADTVVVGSRGLGAVAEALLGSTSLPVAAHALCPVVVVPEPTGRPHTEGRVVVGIDGSELSDHATGYAFEHAATRGLGLTVLNAWNPPVRAGVVATRGVPEGLDNLEVEHQVMTAAALVGWTTKYPGVDVRTVVIQGRPADVIVDASDRADLVVLGSRGRGGFQGLLLGSVSRSVLHRANCPVAVVRPESRDGLSSEPDLRRPATRTEGAA